MRFALKLLFRPNALLLLKTSTSTAGSTQWRSWVPCAQGQELFLRPPSTKLTEFELKNRCKNAEEAKAKQMLYRYLFLF